MAIFTESKNRRWLRQEEKKRNVVFFLKLLKVERKGGEQNKNTRDVWRLFVTINDLDWAICYKKISLKIVRMKGESAWGWLVFFVFWLGVVIKGWRWSF